MEFLLTLGQIFAVILSAGMAIACCVFLIGVAVKILD